MNPAAPTIPSIAPRLLHEETAGVLRDLIVEGGLAPGSRLNERELCERLGVSRTPLREAIKSLAAEGLVELLPNRGAVVAALDIGRLRDLIEVMGGLEAQAAELACKRAGDAQIAAIRALHDDMLRHYRKKNLAGYFRCNQRIHLGMVEAAGNAELADIYRRLNDHVRRVRYMANLSPERWAQAVAEHEDMMEALEARNARRLKAIARNHLSAKMLAVAEALERDGAPSAA